MLDQLVRPETNQEEKQKAGCVTCGRSDCLHLGTTNSEGEIKAYCCFHVPRKYRNRKITEYACDNCRKEMLF